MQKRERISGFENQYAYEICTPEGQTYGWAHNLPEANERIELLNKIYDTTGFYAIELI